MAKPKQQNRVSIAAENLAAQIVATLDAVLDDSVDAKVWERTLRTLERLMQKRLDCKEQLAEMAAFFQKERRSMIEMLNCDCMSYMAGLPDKAFDLAIVDNIRTL